MLKTGLIGLGNTGGQIAALAHEKLKIDVRAINSSEKDLTTVPESVPKRVIKLKDGSSQGAGKDRKKAKLYLKDSITSLLNDDEFFSFISELDVLFVVSSTGGGTGSGTALVMANILEKKFPDTKVIIIGVLPVNGEAFGSHVNTLEYLKELYSVLENPTYLLYDNDKCEGLPSYQIMQKVNNEVVEDIRVMTCYYNFSTQFDSIDDMDMSRILRTPGRIIISRLEGFSEKDCDSKTIEDMIIDNIKRNCHVESQRDKKVINTGIITNLSQLLTSEFDNNIPKVKDFIGEPINAFNHIFVNNDRKDPNNVFFIMSGLSAVDDKINLVSDRIDEIDRLQKSLMSEQSAINNDTLNEMSKKNSETDKTETEINEQINLDNIFSSFGI